MLCSPPSANLRTGFLPYAVCGAFILQLVQREEKAYWYASAFMRSTILRRFSGDSDMNNR